MDTALITQQLNHWLETFVEQPHPALGGWPPCPYARQARLTQQILVRPGTELLRDAVESVAHGLWQREVVIYWYDPALYSSEEFVRWCGQINAFVAVYGIHVLDDHPDDIEIVNGVTFNFGHAALMIMQLHSKLNTAARTLAAKGYYEGWPEEYLQKLFHGRQDPRK